MAKGFSDRLEALEAARRARLTPLERALDLVDRSVPVDQWPDVELEAYCAAECAHLATLTDAQVEELAALDADAAMCRYQELTGQPWPV
jgi:hypothetical protein